MSEAKMTIYEAVKNNVIPVGSILALCLVCTVIGWLVGLHTGSSTGRE